LELYKLKQFQKAKGNFNFNSKSKGNFKNITIKIMKDSERDNNIFDTKIFNLEDRLVRFAGECVLFTRKLDKTYENEYYKNQKILYQHKKI
jgi:hypothetical protein